MSDTPFQEPDATAAQASPGELLQRERENLGLTREEVAAALNLRPAVIDGLERDSYEEVPIATYRRGYLRSYASLLGLDEDAVLSAYHAHFGKEDLEHRVTPVHVVSRPPSRIGTWLFRLVTLIVIAGLIGLTLMWWQSRGGSEPPAPGDTAAVTVDDMDGNASLVEEAGSEGGTDTGESDANSTTSADTPPSGDTTSLLEAPEEAASDNTQNAATDATGEADNEGSATASDSASTDTAPDTSAAGVEGASTNADHQQASADAPADGDTPARSDTATTETSTSLLELSFNEQSWTEIFDASNQRVFVGLQEPGTTASVEGTPPFRLTVGNATGVELSWDGEVIDLSERAGTNNVARFTLGE
ncbi:DUF4115 domain-containing protein [Halomonas sp. 18H]|uniref:RodZ domain-containing protein n=1 Tax=Halomonas almeriensis TaxID=308163 RepID=UPI00223088EA|nr:MULTISPECIES: RodZ domain-containing protein [Halomonas]MCW4153509.1 DUF4115 domain-containing protein [Halomonas sp. 18H]MDN3551953.1 DUF4115 domain-containing protein [Halomonas almeriensis]